MRNPRDCTSDHFFSYYKKISASNQLCKQLIYLHFYCTRDCISLEKIIYNAAEVDSYGYSQGDPSEGDAAEDPSDASDPFDPADPDWGWDDEWDDGWVAEEDFCYYLSENSRVFYNAGSSGSGIEVIFGDSVEKIPSYLFYASDASYSPNIKSVTIGCNVTEIDGGAFYNCVSLETINYNAVKLSSSLSEYSAVFYNAGSSGSGIEVIFGESVEEIPAYLFYASDASYSPNIKSVTIGKNVSSVGEEAFYNCDRVESVFITDANAWCNIEFGYSSETPMRYADKFLYIDGNPVTELVLPDSVTSIGDYAFWNCSLLTSITIPSSVTYIGRMAFGNCTSLETINYNAVKLSSSLSGYSAVFYNAGSSGSGIEVIFGDDVEEIPEYLFYGYEEVESNIKSVIIGRNVASIGDYAFYCCTSLESITIPESVTSIGWSAFGYCTSLSSITIPESVTIIEEGTFRGCTSLEEITLPFIGAKRGITGTKDSVFGFIFGYSENGVVQVYSEYYDGYARYNIPNSLKKVTITDETIVPHGAFYNCANLTDVIIEGNPTVIMAAAFMGHENLWNVTIKSKNVRYANSAMFYYADLPTLYGYKGSSTEAYAEKYEFWFVPIDGEAPIEKYTLDADAVLVNGKIVIDITTDKPVTDQALHVALYNDASKLVDYIIVPLTKEYCSFNVVFRDEQNSSFAKVFLWDGLESMTPIAQAKTVTIKNK